MGLLSCASRLPQHRVLCGDTAPWQRFVSEVLHDAQLFFTQGLSRVDVHERALRVRTQIRVSRVVHVCTGDVHRGVVKNISGSHGVCLV